MAAITLLKKSPYVIEWIKQTDPPGEASKVQNMSDQSLLLSLNKVTY